MSSVDIFLKNLAGQGIVLWENGGKLKFRAPKGTFTPALRQQVNEQKTAIIAALHEKNAVRQDHDNRLEPFPLTDVQAAYLLGRTQAWQGGGTGCHGYAELAIVSPGRYTTQHYTAAWTSMVSCHDMLRVRISHEGWQQILPDVAIPLTVTECETNAEFERVQDRVRQTLKQRDYCPEKPPLIEAHVVTMKTQATLHLSVDLIMTDFIGIKVILTDFFQALNQSDMPLMAPSLSFRDYVMNRSRQRNSASGQEICHRARQFWQNKLASFPPPLNFGPSDVTEEGSVQYRRRSQTLNAPVWQAFLAQARNYGVTPTVVALAALCRVARRYGSAERSRITLTVLDRQPLVDDVMRIVGDFTSTLLIPVSCFAGKNMVALASSIQHDLFEALDNSEISGVEVLRMFPDEMRQGESATPVVLTSTLGAGDEETPFYHNRIAQGLSQTPQVLLDIQLSDHQGGIAIVWDARVGAYPDAVLDAAFEDFCALLTALSTEPARWHDDPLPRKILKTVIAASDTKNAPAGNLLSAFCDLARQCPEKLALIHSETRLTRGALMARARAWRNVLYTRGCRPGDAVLIALAPGVDQIAAQLGALLSGAAFVPIDPAWPVARQEAILTTLQASYPGKRQHCFTVVPANLNIERAQDRLMEDSIGSEQDIAYIIFTSGSTGMPKGVPITHSQALTTLISVQQMLKLVENDRVLAVSRPTFDLSIFNVFGMLNAGGVIVIPSAGTTPDPESWAQDMVQHAVTVWNSVPAQLQLLLDTLENSPEITRAGCRSWRFALLSGDWISVMQPQQLYRLVPECRFMALGGATEASIWSNYHEVEKGARYQRSIPYGRPLPGQAMQILNIDCEEAVQGQIGQIVIAGPAVSTGYLGADSSCFISLPDATLPAFLTGDSGRYLDNGEIEFLGRCDDQIKRHGHRIEPGEIAALLRTHDAVGDAAVVLTAQQQLVAVVTATQNRSETTTADDVVVKALGQQHEQCLTGLNASLFSRLLDTMELAALIAMKAIRQRNIPAKPEHLPLMARWDRLLAVHSDSLASLQEDISLQMASDLWQQASVLAQQLNYGDKQLAYVGQCLHQLEQVVRGVVDPLALLFPEGQMDVARASYGDNLISRYLNRLIVAGVAAHARRALLQQRPLRILEIGGGVGGTTEPIITALRQFQTHDELKFDYLFTDVSHFFLHEADKRWPELTCKLFDVNLPFAVQGIALATWDVVVCANVLHNARHIPRALDNLYSLLALGGDLAIIDATRPNAPLMVTMEFKEGLTDFTDERAVTGDAFFHQAAWQHALQSSRFARSVMFPCEDKSTGDAQKAIEKIHQRVIWAQSGSEGIRLNMSDLKGMLQQRLPAYMIPDRLLALETIPLTLNGKVDRRAIADLSSETSVLAKSINAHPAAQTLNAHQHAVAVIWAEVIGLDGPESLTPEANFFDVGGDSLLLARCIGQLRRRIPGASDLLWDDVLRLVVADPSLGNCTRVIWNEQGISTDTVVPESSVSLQELLPASGKPREGEVLCFVHDGSGGLEPYRDVINALALLPEHPAVVGVSRRPDDGYFDSPPEMLFESLAERYVEALLVRKVRRVCLFGYCMGGLIAAVMAEKLTEAGIEVKRLIVVSSYRIPFIIEDDVLLDYSLARLLNRQAADIGLNFPEAELGALLNMAREKYGNRLPQGCVAQLSSHFPAIQAVLDSAPVYSADRLALLAQSEQHHVSFDVATLQALRAVYVASLRAVGAFSRPAWLGDITFLRQRGEIYFLPTLREDMSAFWRDYCLGELSVVDIDGNHFDCLQEAGAQHVAELLREEALV